MPTRATSPLLRVLVCALALAALAVDGRAVACPVAQDTADTLAKKLKDPDEKVRRNAVELVARANTPAGWPLVVDALGDASPLVADEAQLRLGATESPAALAALQGKGGLGAKVALVRARAAEALGRVPVEIDATALAKLLTDRDSGVRRATVRAIERLVGGKHIAKRSVTAVIQRFDQLFKSEKDMHVRAAAYPARFGVEPIAADDLWSVMFDGKDEGPAYVSIVHLRAEVELDEVIQDFDELIEKVRFDAARAFIDELVERPSASSARSLAAAIGRRRDQRLQWWIVEVLERWSGRAGGRDADSWGTWADSLGDDWKPVADGKIRGPKDYKTPASLFGLPILSDAFVVLVDMTGWTMEKSADGKSTRVRIKDELAKMLRALPEGTAFKIVPYAKKPMECGRDWLLPTRLESINDALKCFAECTVEGPDNFIEAMERALRLPGLDTIVVVTDSAPAGAQHVHPELVLEELTQMNRFHGVFVEALLVNPDAALEVQWKKVCAPSGGRVMKAEL